MSDIVKVQAALALVVQRLSAGVKAAFAKAGAAHQRAMAERFKPYGGVGFGGGGAAGIQTRSGALRRSFGWETRGEGLDSALRVFSAGLPYARIQEEGGVVRPKNKRYLTVPLPDALTPGGSLKGGARLVPRGNKYQTADGLPTFVFRSKRGNLLVGARARNGRLRLLYALKPQVTLKPRLGFRETFERVTRPMIDVELRRAAVEAVR